MEEERSSDPAPVFVLTCARSGSTLLRLLLDAHSKLACPPELNLSELCWQLLTAWQGLDVSGADLEERRGRARDQARTTISEIVSYHLERRGKQRWCDKSLTNATRAELLLQVFPEAQFICLYRHPMDVVVSGIEASPWGFSAYGFGPYVARYPGNFVAALLEYWIEHVERMLQFEQQYGQAFRCYYETLATEPAATVGRIFSFLGVDDEDVCSKSLQRPHDQGAADRKIEFEAGVHTASIGRGTRIPLSLIPPSQRTRMNQLLASLGYPLVSDDWNMTPSPLRASLPGSGSAAADKRIERLLRTRFLGARTGTPAEMGAIKVVVEGSDSTSTWLVDQSKRRVTRMTEPDTVILLEEEALRGVSAGESHPSVAIDRGQLRVFGRHNGETTEAETISMIRQLAGGRWASSEND